MNLGISYGFIFFAYKSSDKNIVQSYVIGYFVLSLIALIVGSFLLDNYIFLYGLILLPIFILDPLLKTKKVFVLMLLPELFLASALFISYLLLEIEGTKFAEMAIIILLILVGTVVYLYKENIEEMEWNKGKLICRGMLTNVITQSQELIKKGFSSYLYQLALFTFLFVDRYLLEKNYNSEALGTCMLAFQFCQLSFYVMSSWNVSSIVEIGELIKKNTLTESYVLKRLIITAVSGAFPLVIFYFLLSFLENTYFKDYENLSLVFLVISIGIYFSNLANCISPILFFFEKQFLASISLLGCVPVLILSYFIGALKEATYITVLEYNYSALVLSSFFTICYALYVLHNVSSTKEEVIM